MRNEVPVHWYNGENQIYAIVYPLGNMTSEQRRFIIRVSRLPSLNCDGEWDKVDISWASHGNQDVEIAKAFGEGLIKAAEVAEEMGGEIKRYSVTITDQSQDTPEPVTYTRAWLGTNPRQILEGHVINCRVGTHIDKVEEI
jgi:hypothetical protein